MTRQAYSVMWVLCDPSFFGSASLCAPKRSPTAAAAGGNAPLAKRLLVSEDVTIPVAG
jgi:hypothetical protein